ncbi:MULTISPECIES: 50S ribosomal protein L22 [Helicobacter]|uniref:Large ribosomal subunit protein uL22 n=1 Tax=Helicobacter typhlonius TaxID=76936 RepID=A0A099UGE4_9HELI|nr:MULTISPECIES: 50S ribosomal protein L22 [Helicobacter]TLD78053.1 50S ribosomal protein L22 [Helicobacter typhlonius]TLD87340.1 50S ribosomal protein L22 [Helicobacter sp. MIT 03-1616]CUU40304.1 LSU ribosomal protein L22p (L17e) [Helicobacter typhlonius]
MSRALLRYIRLSPTKARLIAREVQGMNAEVAIASLEFTPNKAAKLISKVIASAVANGGYDAQDVIITSCRIDAGPVLRRFMPRAKGRATPIRKPTAHILVEVGTSKGAKKSVEAPKQKDSGKRIEAKESTKVKTATKPKAEVKTESKAKTTAKKTEDAKKVSTKKTEGEEK